MLGAGSDLPGSRKVTITGMDGNSIDLYIWLNSDSFNNGLFLYP